MFHGSRIEVVTEGVLTRMLQNDAALEGVGVVIFDEFHERSLQADLGLALVLDARENLSPDLKVLVMSATLDGEAVARLLGDAPIVTSEGTDVPGRVTLCRQRDAGASRAAFWARWSSELTRKNHDTTHTPRAARGDG